MDCLLTHQALNGITDAYNEKVHKVRNPRTNRCWWQNVRLVGRFRIDHYQGEIRVQDAYTLRCIPQIHGASFQVFNYVKEN